MEKVRLGIIGIGNMGSIHAMSIVEGKTPEISLAGVYTKQVRKMNEAAAKTDRVFGMMFNQRTNHVYRKMHEIVRSGKYGKIKRVNWIVTDWYRTQAYYNSGGWRDGCFHHQYGGCAGNEPV